jgi:hypothetical protein
MPWKSGIVDNFTHGWSLTGWKSMVSCTLFLRNHWIVFWAGPRDRPQGIVEERYPVPFKNRTRVMQHVTRHCTYWGLPVVDLKIFNSFNMKPSRGSIFLILCWKKELGWYTKSTDIRTQNWIWENDVSMSVSTFVCGNIIWFSQTVEDETPYSINMIRDAMKGKGL